MTRSAPHEALKMIGCGKLTFDGRVVVLCVDRSIHLHGTEQELPVQRRDVDTYFDTEWRPRGGAQKLPS